MKHTCLFILLFTVLGSRSQNHRFYYTDVDFTEKQADTLYGKIESMLIMGMGSSLERIFLNNLSDKLIEDLSSKKIAATYVYIGKSAEEAKKNYTSTNMNNYDAILFFHPTDTNRFDIQLIKSRIYIPLPTTPIGVVQPSRKRDTYEQSFDILLYKRADNVELKIWTASVDIDCEPGKKNGANKLATRILERFTANRYVE
ncbi:MAG: hypothetical protein JWP81_2834 [Ferruginibacter sp.]|nr:hypothetical protein [Ferruginibacter sp.]